MRIERVSVICLLLLVGCVNPVTERSSVVLWHAYRGAEANALAAAAAKYNATKPKKPVRLVGLPYDAFANKLRVSVPRGNGPDLFIFAHDQVGDWARNGLIEPLGHWLTDDDLNLYLKETISGLIYRDALYGLPMGFKTLALYYDTTLVQAPPETLEDLVIQARRVRSLSESHWGLGYPVDSFYYHAPFLHGFKSEILDVNGGVSVDTPGMRQSITFIRKLLLDGLMPKDAASAQIAALFKKRLLAFVIDGPWFENALKTHSDWAVAPLPIVGVSKKALSPFLGVEAIMMSARSVNKDAALAVARFITSDEAAEARWTQARQLVANRLVYERDSVKSDPFAAAFRAQLARTTTLSNDPVVRQIWSPLSRALSQTIIRGKSLESALREAQKAIKRASE